MCSISRVEDPRGVRMITCLYCADCFQTQEDRCPGCNREAGRPRSVLCADIHHNDNGGCHNEDCWKYRGK